MDQNIFMRSHTMSTGAFNMIGGPPPPQSSSRLPGSAAYQNTCPPPPPSSNHNRVPPSSAAYQNTCPPPPTSSNYNRILNANPKNENLSHDHPKDFTPSRTLITPPAPPPPPPKKSSRVDANEIPRPLKPQKDIIYTTRSGATRKVPPHSGSFFKAIDKGNCSPRLMRVTACAVPTTKDVLGNTGIPLALVVTPFAGPENGEEPLHLVDMGESPPRCTRCGSYINPSVLWTDDGNKWSCNLCSTVNITPAWYFSSLDGAGLRLDRDNRPELSRGAVDFLVGKDYSNKLPQAPIIVFVINICTKTVFDGSAQACLNAIKNLIISQSFQSKETKIGIITFNDKINFYDVRMTAKDIVKISITDPDDCVPPLPLNKWIFSPIWKSNNEDMNALLYLLDKLLKIIQDQYYKIESDGGVKQFIENNNYEYNCSKEVLITAQMCLKETGGRVIMMTSSAVGGTKIKPDTDRIGYGFSQGKISGSNEREKLGVYGTDDELSLYCNLAVAVTISNGQTGTDRYGKNVTDREKEKNNIEDYIKLSEKMAKSNINVDIFFLVEDRLLSDRLRGKGPAEDLIFKDFALLTECCDYSGGKLHLISGNMRFEDNIQRLNDELEHLISLYFASESVMKLRCSKGLIINKYCGIGMYDPLLETVELAGLTGETCVCYTVRHDRSGVIKDEDKVHFQLAILHTDMMQRKVVRVLNLTVMASNSPAIIFRHTDLDCVVAAITKIAVEKALRLPLSITANAAISGKEGTGEDVRARDWIVAIVAEILTQYRKHCSIGSPKGDLVIPEPLKLLPLYALGMLKHTAFLENVSIQKRPNTVGLPTLLSIQRLTVRASERTFELRRLKSLDCRAIISSLYPRFFSMKSFSGSDHIINKTDKVNNNSNNNNNNDNNSCSGNINGNKIQKLLLPSHSPPNTNTGNESPVPMGTINLPPSGILGPQSLLLQLPAPLSVTSEALESDGMYLLDDGTMMWLILGKTVPLDWLECIIEGVECSLHDKEKPQKIRILTGERNFGGFPGAIADNLEKTILILRKIGAYKQELRVVWSDEHANPDAIRMGVRFVEDSVYGANSYVEFLCKLHAIVKSKLEKH